MKKEPILGWLDRIEIAPHQRDGFEVYLIFRKDIKRGRKLRCQPANFEEYKIGLFYVLEALKVQEHDLALIDLLQGGVRAIWNLGERYDWFRHKQEEKEKVVRSKEFHEKRKKSLLRRGQFVRSMDI